MEEKKITSYPLRIPQDLREKVNKSAIKNNRSVNQEIITIIETYFQQHSES